MGHLERWADPADPIWKSPIQSPCAQNSKTPDRIDVSAAANATLAKTIGEYFLQN